MENGLFCPAEDVVLLILRYLGGNARAQPGNLSDLILNVTRSRGCLLDVSLQFKPSASLVSDLRRGVRRVEVIGSCVTQPYHAVPKDSINRTRGVDVTFEHEPVSLTGLHGSEIGSEIHRTPHLYYDLHLSAARQVRSPATEPIHKIAEATPPRGITR